MSKKTRLDLGTQHSRFPRSPIGDFHQLLNYCRRYASTRATEKLCGRIRHYLAERHDVASKLGDEVAIPEELQGTLQPNIKNIEHLVQLIAKPGSIAGWRWIYAGKLKEK